MRKMFIFKMLVLALIMAQSVLWAGDKTAPVTVGIAETCRKKGVVMANAVVAKRFSEAGAVAFVIPRTSDKDVLERTVSQIDALVLSGGEDVSPARYNEPKSPKLEGVNLARDAFEVALLDAAVKRGIPVIGICRGCQLINVYFGGSLYQDIGDEVKDIILHRAVKTPRHYVRHNVEVVKGSLFERIAGGKYEVYSWHHQAAKKVAPGFRVTARSSDGIVEVIESEKVFGVQFHPECVVTPSDVAFARTFFGGLIKWIDSFR